MSVFWQKWTCVLAGCVALWGAGCGTGGGQSDLSSEARDTQIFTFKRGMAVGDVKKELGDPSSEADIGGEEVLSYGAWQLRFGRGGLIDSRKDHVLDAERRSGVGVDRTVLRLKKGIPAKAIRERLGRPNRYQEVVISGRIAGEILLYGPWEIRIANGVLQNRTKW